MTVEELRAEARQWLSEADIPTEPEDQDEWFEALRVWQRRLFDAGWMGLHWPAELGGRGLTALHHLAFYEELAAAHAPPPIGLIGLDVVGPTLVAFGNEVQRRRLVPPLLSGEEIWCQGFSEPDAGSDLAGIRTTGRLAGDAFIVDGQKVWTSWAHKADWCALLARTDPAAERHRGISYLIVDMRSEGVTVRPLRQLTGDDEFCEVFFDSVEVPAANLVGDLHDGWRLAMHTLAQERSVYAVRRRLEIQMTFDDVVERLGTFAEVGAHTDVVEELGLARVALSALEAQNRKTVARIALGAGSSPIDSVDKLLLTDVEKRVFGALARILGAFRLQSLPSPWGLDSSRLMKGFLYAQAASIYGGTSQIQRNIVAQRLLGMPR
ncbi:MAG: acyl-CoA dehydrogenase family protein [Acidimicrobiia bacterium]|nr:acyl-CoA dehydrogenase family protein [Acidimicrobiia bacterium]